VGSSLNDGWTADPERNKPGRYLRDMRYDMMAEALGCYAEYVAGPGLQRAFGYRSNPTRGCAG
jgi:hypothetical protein